MTDLTPTRAEVVHRMARNMITSHTKKDLAEWGLSLEAENQALRERAEAAEAELHTMKTAGIIEVAVRNPSVMEYMQHWEGRAERAERAEAAAWNDAIEALASKLSEMLRATAKANEKNHPQYAAEMEEWADDVQDEARALRRAAPTEGEA